MSTTKYKVQNGDCLESIAQKHGFFHETLWNLDENGGLRRQRKDPNILLPGDIVYIPEVDPAKMSRAIDQRHTFRRRGVPSKFHMRFMRHGKPRANIPFLVRIDGGVGTTGEVGDGVGRLQGGRDAVDYGNDKSRQTDVTTSRDPSRPAAAGGRFVAGAVG